MLNSWGIVEQEVVPDWENSKKNPLAGSTNGKPVPTTDTSTHYAWGTGTTKPSVKLTKEDIRRIEEAKKFFENYDPEEVKRREQKAAQPKRNWRGKRKWQPHRAWG